MKQILKLISGIFRKKNKDVWEYGTCRNRKARRHKTKGNVQFVLWEAGEQHYTEDYWHNFDSSWWTEFKPTANLTNKNS